MKQIWISVALVGALFLVNGCKEKTETKVLTKEVAFTKEGELQLLKAKNDSVVARLDIEIADDDYQTETGLMYRKSMPAHQGMLFVFNDERVRAFYMKNTEFPLDILFINSNKEIVTLVKNAKAFDQTSLPSDAPSTYVLEVNAGLSDKWGLEKGDKILWNRSK
ncbi:hypothetical protein ATE92_1707 [Ulvibacter sp. MAR_2010_11]|uniref:DUF192 domain-containing protein n=1 Tax=Ulvibacter sp. MAR_2010_11 TaxID=1250229 RepID=UPI000C2B7490|nr:DUF192 domain-containing protein [Ulvibacter sp. MAR_2010_11]PKA83551.1 hypothetical protein ATE92_1707 [Ulvibacter sp. MAR_2010_11]